MDCKIGFTSYSNINHSTLNDLISDLLVFRYFITEQLLVELTFEDPSSWVYFTSAIYISTYSPTEPSIYLILPQILSPYSPDPSAKIFTKSFIQPQMRSLPKPLNSSLTPRCYAEKYSKSVLGGTFDHIHAGHFLFLTIAASLSSFLGIGVTGNELLLNKKGKEYIQAYSVRAENVRRFFSVVKKDLEIDIFPISDPVGKAGSEDYDGIILTTEVEKAFESINAVRAKNNLRPLQKTVVDLAELDQGKISSTDVRSLLEIKSKGKYIQVKGYWERLSFKLGVNEEVRDKWWGFISVQYSRNCRFYHTLSHLHSLFQATEENLVKELSIFFHDLVYIPMSSSGFNELASLMYFKDFCSEAQIHGFEIVEKIIESTIKHLPLVDDENLVEFLDMDLLILAESSEGYEEYCRDIRKEYSWLTEEEFRTGRSKVLEAFLTREKIYQSQKFESFEGRARKNLEKELSFLKISPNL